MKILMINSVCGIGSTGRICTDLAQEFERDGHEVKIAYGRDENVPEKFRKYAIQIGTPMDVKLHGLRTRILDEHGFGSKRATKKFLKWAEDYKPDLLWLHNIHGYYINVELLFEWIKKHPEMEVKWTLHDCWAFTGHCSHFTVVGCDKWKNQCKECVQKCEYPASKGLDNSKNNYIRKKKAFTGVNKMTIITPSKWLADLVKQSFFSDYPVEVHYNKIDTNIFKPTPSNFREKYGIEDKIVVLGVASTWTEKKGLGDFIELIKMLDDKYAVVLVGLSEQQLYDMSEKLEGTVEANKLDDMVTVYSSVNSLNVQTETMVIKERKGDIILKNENGMVISSGVNNLYSVIMQLQNNVLRLKNGQGAGKVVCIKRTTNAHQLAEIYSIADYFVNPTYEDNYPTVNLEAKACGTYVITYDTGGCRETIMF